MTDGPADPLSDALRQPAATSVRRQLRFSNAAWITLATVPVLAWLVLATQTMTYRSPAPVTSDPLFNRFMERISRHIAFIQSDATNYYYYGAGIPAYELAGWEKEFGNDPRFWQLCYYFANELPEEYVTELPGSGYDAEVHYLEEARRRGIADPLIMIELYTQVENAVRQQAREALQSELTGVTDRIQINLAYWRYIDEHFAAEFAQLQDEVLAVAGDDSWPYYRFALVAFEHGDYDAAWELIAQGNRAPVSRLVLGFPFTEIVGEFWAGRKPPDSFIGGVLCERLITLPLPNYIRFKEMVIRLAEDARAREDLAVLNELHVFCCRFGAVDNGSLIQAMVGRSMAQKVLDAAQNNWPEKHSAKQRQGFAKLQQKWVDISNTSRNISNQCTNANRMARYTGVQTSKVRLSLDLLGGSLWLIMDEYESLYDAFYIEYSGMHTQIVPLFEEVAQFDYATLSWPEEGSK
ncbi:hypothetical protein JW859_03535 [bacterium]|nr:hypothetical protein [bacterium]